MAVPTPPTTPRRLRAFAAFASTVVMAVPSFALLGWIFDVSLLKSVVPGFVAMNPVTALAFLLGGSGLAFALREERNLFSRLAGAVTSIIGAAVLTRYLFDWPVWIDTTLFTASLQGNVMAPTTACAFMLTGVALALLDGESRSGWRPAQMLALAVGFMALLALTGYIYRVEKLYRLSSYIAMAVHTATCFLLLAAALLCARPDRGLMVRVSGRGPGGQMLRRILLWVFAVPVALGWVILSYVRSGSLDAAYGFTIFVIGVIAFLAALLWRNAGELNLKGAEQARASAALERAREGLETVVEERTRELRKVVDELREGLQVLGAAGQEILASTSDLAATSAESATSVAETTATVEEVRQTAHVASSSAQRVAASAARAAEISGEGTAASGAVSGGMQRIRDEMRAIGERMTRLSEQTQAIGEIIAAVDAISEQSSMLAVNAAIQAARAGAEGKGFAVVADEVKYLAGQSRNATKQVRAILSDVQNATTAAVMAVEQASKAVDAGSAQSQRAGSSIETLTAQISGAAQAAMNIATSSKEQLLGMDQVALAMEQIKSASADSAAQARQLEKAARNLNDLGRRLTDVVERHKS